MSIILKFFGARIVVPSSFRCLRGYPKIAKVAVADVAVDESVELVINAVAVPDRAV